MDLLFAEEIVADNSFFRWLIEKTRYPSGSLVSVGRSQATVHGETDLLVEYDTDEGIRHAILIEDKIAAGFMPNQDSRYRKRLAEGINEGRWEGGTTVLIAPQKYLDEVDEKDFDVRISYEDVLTKIETATSGPRAEFKAAMIRAAITKTTKPWTKVVDQALSRFYDQLISHAKARNPEIPIPRTKQQRAPTSKWIVFGLPDWPKSRVFIEIKPHNGVVDLRLTGVSYRAAADAFSGQLGPNMDIVPTPSSVSIRLASSPINVENSLESQIGEWNTQLDNTKTLLAFLEANTPLIQKLTNTI